MEIDKSGVAAYGVKVKNFTVTRSQAIRIYAVLIVIAVCEYRARFAVIITRRLIWRIGIVTMTFLLICVISVFLGKGIKTEVLVLPVTNLFAFTQLRSTMPGAPSGFGEFSFSNTYQWLMSWINGSGADIGKYLDYIILWVDL